jgi:hypothetical protein
VNFVYFVDKKEKTMKARTTQLIISILIGVFLLFGLMLLADNSPRAQADTVPTPVAIMNPSDSAVNVTFMDADTNTTSVAGSGMQLYTYEYCNFQWVIDQDLASGVANTTTLKVQWSMDDSTWSDGPNLVASNAADGDGVVQVPNLGRYIRVYATHDDTGVGDGGITTTVKALCK